MTLVQRASEALDRPISRRNFLHRVALGATALTVAPMTYLLKPVTAYAAICTCSGQSCDCGALCCSGYTAFCCQITGQNACPSGTIPAGWWKADGSGICDNSSGAQPRYYIDCNVSDCGGCGCGSSGLCSGGCQNQFDCECANGDCRLRKSSCTHFRYGQCNQHVRCVGPIVCRVVTCTAPWVWSSSCTTTSATDNATRFHNAPCLSEAPPPPPPPPPATIPLVGDWTGGGIDTPGTFSGGHWVLKRSDGGPDIEFDYGNPNDMPMVGDWNGDGVDTPGLFRGGEWLIRNSNTTGVHDFSFWFGNPGDVPIIGDWTGDGTDLPGLHRRSDGRILLRNSNTTGVHDRAFFFGNPGDIAIAGDFDGDGQDSVSLYRPSEQRFYIINRLGSNGAGLGAAEYSYLFGNPGDTPLSGDWNGDGVDSAGLYRDGDFYLRNSNSTGVHDLAYT